MAAKKAAAKKSSAKKSSATKASAKKVAAKKATATKTSAKRVTAKKSPAKATAKAPAKKAADAQPAKKASPASAPRKRTSFAAGASRAQSERHAASPLLRATAEQETVAEVAAERRLRVVRDDEPIVTAAAQTRPPSTTKPGMLEILGTLTGTLTGNQGDGVENAVETLANILQVGASAAGLRTDEAEEQVARTLAYLRRRAAGDYTVDDFGFDEDFTENVWLPLLRPLYQKWFRVEVRGIENVPSTGGALVVANHSGTVPVDGLMTQVAIHDAHPAQRHMRMLGADLVFELPFVGKNARRTGSTLATAADAERLLSGGELVGVYPEGFKGVGKPFSERYKLQRFGRGGFVNAALRTSTPIIPCAIVGAEEIYPLIGNISVLARLMGAPYFPVTPFFPLLGPLGLIPLPSKWIIAFGTPVDTAAIGPAGAEDPMLVFDLTDQVRETIQQSLYSLLMQRRSVFF